MIDSHVKLSYRGGEVSGSNLQREDSAITLQAASGHNTQSVCNVLTSTTEALAVK